jgi:hypothetical protein
VHRYLSVDVIDKFVPMMVRRHVSEVARSPRGFLPAYRLAGGKHSALSLAWRAKREGFVARHMAQVRASGESLWDYRGFPSRRHLALIAWAYTPYPDKIVALAKRFS